MSNDSRQDRDGRGERDGRVERESGEPVEGGEARGFEGRGVESFARRAIEAGVGRMLHTEEGLRSIAAAVLPRELVGKALDGVDAAKTEAVAVVGRELRAFLANLNVGEELAKILTSVSFEVRMQVRFVPNEDGTLRASVQSDGGPKVKIEPRADGKGAVATPARRASAPAAATAPSAGAPTASAAAPHPVDDAQDVDGFRDPAVARRKLVRSVVGRIAERTAATARAAAEVAADAAAEVVNRSLELRDNDADEEVDSY